MDNQSLLDKRHAMQWWISPHRDNNYQWWWGHQQVRMIVLPASEKDKYLKRMKNISD